jgi:hypothetical protein
MERVTRIAGLAASGTLLATLLAGCGGGAGGSNIDAAAMAELRQVFSKEPLLPEGFSARPDEAWRVPFKPADRNCRAVLDLAGGRAPERALTAQAAASYQGDGLGEQAGVGLARYADGEAREHIDALTRALESCRAVRAGAGTRLRMTELPIEPPIEDVGDEAVGAELRGKLNGYPYALDVVFARSGDTLVSVVHTGIADVDPGRTRQLLSAAVGMATA